MRGGEGEGVKYKKRLIKLIEKKWGKGVRNRLSCEGEIGRGEKGLKVKGIKKIR
jgi:hypothetical protein